MHTTITISISIDYACWKFDGEETPRNYKKIFTLE